MPRSSFYDLPAVHHASLPEAAARKFSEHGYKGAPLNRILAEAGLPKGAAYYDFEDVAERFAEAARAVGGEP